MARYIDADELVGRYEQTISDYKENGLFPSGFGIHDAIDWTVDVPTADVVEAKHGHWIFAPAGCFRNEFKCSLCQEREPHMTDFCPNCGAKMDEED